jgi:adenylate kinase family enzyme
VILGSGGAGKTRLALDLAERTGLPVVHLDPLFWRPHWQPAPIDEARAAVAAAVEEPRWIMDGNFLGLGLDDPRFRRADTVVFLDVPRTRCLCRIANRRVRDRGRRRVDLPEGCKEGLERGFVLWVWRYQRDNRPRVLELLGELERRGVDVYRVRSGAELPAL